MGKVVCLTCKKKCKGDVLKVGEKYFHKSCFKCEKCKKSLEAGGFFSKDNFYYCPQDYRKHFAPKCQICSKVIDGDVVFALNTSFHRQCFHCQSCVKYFEPGDRVSQWGSHYYCKVCLDRLQNKENNQPSNGSHPSNHSLNRSSQNGDHMPAHCQIPTPQPSNGEPIRGSRNINDLTVNIDGSGTEDMNSKQQQYMSLPARYDIHPSPCFSSASGDTLQSRQSRPRSRTSTYEFGKFYNQSYLSLSQRRLPVSERDTYRRTPSASSQTSRTSTSQHFHVPSGQFTFRNSTASVIKKGQSLPSMQLLAPRSQTAGGVIIRSVKSPRASSPETDAARKLASYPNAHEESNGVRPIDRDDFPAPPSTGIIIAEKMREKRRRNPDNSMSADVSMDSRLDRIDGGVSIGDLRPDQNTQQSGMFRAILVEDSIRKGKSESNLDPVSSSRVPSAREEPHLKQRYDIHQYASPSRDTLREQQNRHPLGYSLEYVSLGNRSTLKSYPSSPRPGYTQGILTDSKLSNFPASTQHSTAWSLNRARSEDFDKNMNGFVSVSIGESGSHLNGATTSSRQTLATEQTRKSTASISRLDRDLSDFDEETGLYSSLHYHSTPSARFRERKPVPPQIIPYEDLRLDNPANLSQKLDRSRLETHLSDEDFFLVFYMPRDSFSRLPEWKRNDLKKRVHLF